MSQRKPRVLLVTKLYSPWIGGIEKHVEDIAQGLKGEFEIKVLCCQEPTSSVREISQRYDINGIQVFKASSWAMVLSMPVSFSFGRHLRRLAQESDVIHYHLPFPLAIFMHWLVRPRVPFIVTWHSDVIRQKKLDFFLGYLTQWFLDQAKTIIVTSQRLADTSNRLGKVQAKIQVVPLGLNAGQFAATEDVLGGARRIRNEFPGCLALFVGRLVPYKGLSYLIEAMVDVEKSAKLLIIGSGPLEHDLKLLARKLGVQERIVFLGDRPSIKLAAYYHACDFFVLPSVTSNEAFGIVQLEAMACSRPVINTLLSTGVPEVSLHEETGLTVEPGNSRALAHAMNHLIHDEAKRRRLGEQGLKRVREVFDQSVVLAKMANIYRGIT